MRSISRKFHQPQFGALVGAALGISVGLFCFFTIFGEPLEEISYDFPFKYFREAGKRDTVAIINLDEASFADLKQNPYSFNGTNHANLIRRLKAEGASPIVFDILFIDPNAPPGDAEFAAAMREHGKVVLGNILLSKQVDSARSSAPAEIREPLEDAAAGWGLSTLATLPNGAVRQHYPGTDRIPSLPWKAAQVADLPVARDPNARLHPRWFNHYGPEPFYQVSYAEVLHPNFKFPFSLKGRAVFVGRSEMAGYASDQKDQFTYPWTSLNGHSPFGVEFHALTFANLVAGDWLRRSHWTIELVLLLAIGGGLGYLLPQLRPLPAAGAAIGSSLLIVCLACFLQLRANFWFDWMTPACAQIPVVLVWAILFHAIRAYFEAQFLNRSLALYLSPGQVQQILTQPEFLKPGVQQREVSILFTDIASFSKISERLLPEDLARLLNDYFENTIGSVHSTDGTVMNLIGDAILAIWNAPQPQDNHRERACQAAVQLAENLIQFDASRPDLRLRTRVGLHTGIVSVGNIGSSFHFDYTVIGENVNLASRLEGLNKQLGTSILATREIQKNVEDQMPNRRVGQFRFKGMDKVKPVYELLVGDARTAREAEWLHEFSSGLHCFDRKAFAEAEKHFKAVLVARPDDGPSQYYLQKIPQFATAELEAEWMGEIDLDSK